VEVTEMTAAERRP